MISLFFSTILFICAPQVNMKMNSQRNTVLNKKKKGKQVSPSKGIFILKLKITRY